MAIALICDVCTNLFPEGQEGSISGMGTMSRIVEGRQQQQQSRMDTCAECVDARNAVSRNRSADVRRSLLTRGYDEEKDG